MWKRMWEWIKASKVNKVVAAAIVVLLVLAGISAVSAYWFHSEMRAAKEAEKVQKERASKLEKDGEAKEEAFRKAIGATDVPLKNALAGVREAKDSLVRAAAARRDLWIPPAVDNGDLVARFNRALEGLR